MSESQPDPLEAILDTLIPASEDGRMPAAGALGLAPDIRQRAAAVLPVIDQGLAAADACAGERAAPNFAALTASDRVAVLRVVESREPGFLPSLLFHAYPAYYQHESVLIAIGLEPRPPHPKGYDLEAGELGALERVRARGRLYREA